MVKKAIKLTSLGLSLAIVACSFSSQNQQDAQNLSSEDVAEARQAANTLQKQLGGRLKAALAEGGLKQGIEVCALEAPHIAAEVSSQFGKTVGRTALRVRNPNNRATSEQEAVLKQFQQSIEQQLNPAELEHFAVLDNGQKLYMRPIVMQGICLACHGELNHNLRANVNQYYPEDQATGFALGELRGAFTVSW